MDKKLLENDSIFSLGCEKRTIVFAFLQSSFARHMCAQGFDTWTMEVRGAGLSTRVVNLKAISSTPTSHLLCENSASYEKYDGKQGVLASQTQSFSRQNSPGVPRVMSRDKIVSRTTTKSLVQGSSSPLSEGCRITGSFSLGGPQTVVHNAFILVF